MVREAGYELGNVDATLILEAPKINPYVPHMCQVLAETMGVGLGDVSIKATTSETMGFVGRGEGVQAFAVVLLEKVG